MASGAAAAGRGNLLVCGGAVVDCIVRPFDKAQRGASRTSMPGEARISHGGVGRNIAEVVTRLGRHVRLVSALGDDEPGRQLLNHCREIGIGVEDMLQVPGNRTATYTALLDGSGELVGAVADMAIFDCLGKEALTSACASLADVGLIVCDANLGAAALEAALLSAKAAGVPAWYEPVSTAKAPRGRLSASWHLATPNWDELLAMIGREARPFPAGEAEALPSELFEAASLALAPGAAVAENLLLSLGPRGCVLASTALSTATQPQRFNIDVAALVEQPHRSRPLPALVVEAQAVVGGSAGCQFLWYKLLKPLDSVQDVTGAGDALLSGTASAFAAGWPLEEAVLAGLLAAHLTLFEDGGVASTLNPSLLGKLRSSIETPRPSRL
eukprot:TRINITY_DN91848_c0_g1_i1.p1 TRINITY_DN91848_c0_g1~~TRINITY_DN91848_c0_g1_i1.p1  ORF type:complete len:385 (+),score=80.14 TRINITY_DN91848_c0_g1_i1:65-1219(+)